MEKPNLTQKLKFPNQSLGLTLIVAGCVWLAGTFFQIDVGEILWPFFIILPGGILLAFSYLTGFGTEKLSIAASVVSAVGLLLLYQNTFSHFESWAYAWALVIPCAGGFGLYLNGAKYKQVKQIKFGQRLMVAGGLAFAAGALFFEMIININGRGVHELSVNSYIWPILFIVAGMFFLHNQRQVGSGE